jgi:hypothetical protein
MTRRRKAQKQVDYIKTTYNASFAHIYGLCGLALSRYACYVILYLFSHVVHSHQCPSSLRHGSPLRSASEPSPDTRRASLRRCPHAPTYTHLLRGIPTVNHLELNSYDDANLEPRHQADTLHLPRRASSFFIGPLPLIALTSL